MSRWSAFVLFIAAAALPGVPAYGFHWLLDFNYRPPVTVLAQYEFTQNVAPVPVSGMWATSGGTFNSMSDTTAIATIDSYIPEKFFQNCAVPSEDCLTEIDAPKFWYRARMLNERSGSSTRVGLVYLYQDAANFYEATFSPTGAVFVREITNGVVRTVATGTHSGGGQGKWFDAEVVWTAAETVILVNGLPVVRGITQNARTRGRVGLITRQTTAKFDRLLATREYSDPEFSKTFTAGEPQWNEVKGTWSVVNGAYQNSAVEHAGLSLMPIFVGFDGRQTRLFTLLARMRNPYGSSGNRMGIAFEYGEGDGIARYKEIVFGPDGIARFNEVTTVLGPGGTTTISPIETAPYPGRRGEWFDVRFEAGDVPPATVNVSVDGTPVFASMVNSIGGGRVGLVTHWTPGRFDDVRFRHGSPLSVLATTFDADDLGVCCQTRARGTWDVAGGVLNNRSAGASDFVYTNWQRSTGYTLTARMLNPYRASGNRIGLLFGLDLETGEYYEVVFAPTGQAYLNKFIQGSLTQVATATHSALGSNVWFNVELVRRGPFATVKVNDQTVFQNVPAAQLDNSLNSGRVGLISHWSPGRFDDLRIEEHR
jgi:hypothetical protein